MTIETLKSPNPRNRKGISVLKSKFLSVSSMNTWLAILATTFYEGEIGSAAQDPIKWSGCPQSKPMSQG